ncbi:MAG: hypothetical protein K8F91_14690, partial [Candidatus Obscuribacterales bacterium]|nr:hypothetical protein [Candidatus Obscuribacterales bacterium]
SLAAIRVADGIELGDKDGKPGINTLLGKNTLRRDALALELGMKPDELTPQTMQAKYFDAASTPDTKVKLEELRQVMEDRDVIQRVRYAKSMTNLLMADQTSKGNTNPEIKIGEEVPQGEYMNGFRYLLRARLHEEETKYSEPGAQVSRQVLDGLNAVYKESQTTVDLLKHYKEGTEAGGRQDRVTERNSLKAAAELAEKMDLATIIEQAQKPENINTGLSKELIGMVTLANGAKLEYANVLVREGKYDEASKLFDSVKVEDFRNANLLKEKGDLIREREQLDKGAKSPEEKAREKERIDDAVRKIDATMGPMLIYGVSEQGNLVHRQYGQMDTAQLENKFSLGVKSVQPQAWDAAQAKFVEHLKSGDYGKNGNLPTGAFRDIRDMYKATELMKRDVTERNKAEDLRRKELELEKKGLPQSALSEDARKVRTQAIDQELEILKAKTDGRNQQMRQQERMTKHMHALLAQTCDDIGTARGLYKEVNDDIIKEFEEKHPEAKGKGADAMNEGKYKDDPLVKLKEQI